MDEIDRLLARVQREAHGKLSMAAYRRLYESGSASGGGTIVEIGTSQGAATLALALGAKSAGLDFRILTVDSFITGSRPRAATVGEKQAIVRRGFETFGVSDRIDLVAGTTEEMIAMLDPRGIGLLLLDADGCIDRDLAALWARMRPGCTVVIDDVDYRNYLDFYRRRLRIDQKHRLTHALVDTYVKGGFLVPEGETGQTGWFRKGDNTNTDELERLARPVYRTLIRAEIGPGEYGVKRGLYGLAASRAPWLVRAWRGIRRR